MKDRNDKNINDYYNDKKNKEIILPSDYYCRGLNNNNNNSKNHKNDNYEINLPSNYYYRLELYLVIMKMIMMLIEEIPPKLIIHLISFQVFYLFLLILHYFVVQILSYLLIDFVHHKLHDLILLLFFQYL